MPASPFEDSNNSVLRGYLENASPPTPDFTLVFQILKKEVEVTNH
jgi:hypothetical protein